MELKDLMEKAKETKNPKELLALAKEADIEMSPQEAEENFALLNKKGELSDEELDNVAGGGRWQILHGGILRTELFYRPV